ncbi:MAG TPA: WD40 repeat domain-containing protein [Aggregatilinea sp.]|uniref:WD40 repeat domain-containing protein n=1 Tax=Aggregatilinea sp. TaxID=2806333 RepID=UPI002C585F61|nr:WD40 repeat domain-containing protein [Aggregatilinea sp.]HML22361.1 WD40 repeat domain-containing protein [Aggregatilinea sp.]
MRRLLILCMVLSCIAIGSPISAQGDPQRITPETVDHLTSLAHFGRGQVRVAGWTPDNSRFVLAGIQGLWFYDAQDLDADPNLVVPFPGWVWNFAISPDGQTIAMANPNGSLYTGEFNPDAQEITDVTLLEESVRDFSFSANSEWLVTLTNTGLTGWRVKGGHDNEPLFGRLEGDPNDALASLFGLQALALSPDNSTVALLVGSSVRMMDLDSGTIRVLLDVQANPELEEYLMPEDVAFSPLGDLLAITWAAGQLTLVDAASGAIDHVIQTHGNLQQVSFSPDGQMVACVWASMIRGGGFAVKVWNSSTGDLVATLDSANLPDSFAFNPDGTQVAIVEGFIPHVWDIATQTQIALPDVHSGPFWAVAVHPEGDQIAVGSRDGIARIFDIKGFTVLQKFDGKAGPVVDVAYSPDGALLATTAADGNVRLWDVVTGELNTVLEGSGAQVIGIAFDSAGELLAGGGINATLRRWDVSTGQEIDVLWQTTALEALFGVAFSPDGSLLAAGNTKVNDPSAAHEVKVWDVNTGAQTTSLMHPGAVSGLVFHPTRPQLAISHTTTLTADVLGYQENVFKDARTTIWLWDAESGSEQIFAQLSGSVSDLTFSPDGRLLLGIEGTHLHIWDFESGNELAVREIAPPIVFTDIAFVPDGTLLITTSDDGIIQLWGIS